MARRVWPICSSYSRGRPKVSRSRSMDCRSECTAIAMCSTRLIFIPGSFPPLPSPLTGERVRVRGALHRWPAAAPHPGLSPVWREGGSGPVCHVTVCHGRSATIEVMAGFEAAPPDLKHLLSERIDRLGLKLEGSPMERYVAELHQELERKGLKRFRPPTYLTDEWGCPSEEPIIGIPFYLADAKLTRLEQEIDEVEDAREIRMYLRHEAGHAFNYAYKLYETKEWRDLFGPFSRPYRERYRPVPFDRSFVRHMEGWYAQKHPDEDFAETFAVWLTPRSR